MDYIGLDVYDVEFEQYPGSVAEFTNMETEPDGLDWLASFASAQHKPIVLPEWGLGWGKCANGAPVTGKGAVCGGDDAIFINDMAHWISTHDVFESNFWDYGSSTVDHGANPRAAAALRADFG